MTLMMAYTMCSLVKMTFTNLGLLTSTMAQGSIVCTDFEIIMFVVSSLLLMKEYE